VIVAALLVVVGGVCGWVDGRAAEVQVGLMTTCPRVYNLHRKDNRRTGLAPTEQQAQDLESSNDRAGILSWRKGGIFDDRLAQLQATQIEYLINCRSITQRSGLITPLTLVRMLDKAMHACGGVIDSVLHCCGPCGVHCTVCSGKSERSAICVHAERNPPAYCTLYVFPTPQKRSEKKRIGDLGEEVTMIVRTLRNRASASKLDLGFTLTLRLLGPTSGRHPASI
jgi:hypothetical protein